MSIKPTFRITSYVFSARQIVEAMKVPVPEGLNVEVSTDGNKVRVDIVEYVK